MKPTAILQLAIACAIFIMAASSGKAWALSPSAWKIVLSLSLYSGQMCTAPQSLFVPASGIETDAGVKSPAEVGEGIARALDKLLGDPARAMAVLGAVQFALISSNNFLCVLDAVPRETTSSRLEILQSDFIRFTSAIDTTKGKDCASRKVVEAMENSKKRKGKMVASADTFSDEEE